MLVRTFWCLASVDFFSSRKSNNVWDYDRAKDGLNFYTVESDRIIGDFEGDSV